MNGKVVITGGAGFIGSHLASRLKGQGRELLLIDNLSTGRRENIADLLDDRCRFIHANADQTLADPDLMRGVGQVYHLAAAVGVKLVIDDPAQMVRNNIDQTEAVLQGRQTRGGIGADRLVQRGVRQVPGVAFA